jgi:hypothetical protein
MAPDFDPEELEAAFQCKVLKMLPLVHALEIATAKKGVPHLAPFRKDVLTPFRVDMRVESYNPCRWIVD